MEAKYVIKWTYTPKDYLEEARDIKEPYYRMWINNGEVRVEVNEDDCSDPYEMLKQIHASLNSRFLGIEVLTNKPYTLSEPTMEKELPDGRKNYFLQPKNVTMRMEVGSPDIFIKDKNGNIIADTRLDRINKQQSFSDLVEKYDSKDSVLHSMLVSHHNALSDPDNELVHLYEIRDALRTKFGGKKQALKALGITKNDWQRLGDLACVEPLKQGRHRGQQAGNLRDATQEELDEAQTIAQRMIEAYLNYLENQS